MISIEGFENCIIGSADGVLVYNYEAIVLQVVGEMMASEIPVSDNLMQNAIDFVNENIVDQIDNNEILIMLAQGSDDLRKNNEIKSDQKISRAMDLARKLEYAMHAQRLAEIRLARALDQNIPDDDIEYVKRTEEIETNQIDLLGSTIEAMHKAFVSQEENDGQPAPEN